jgi:hypothetical protein
MKNVKLDKCHIDKHITVLRLYYNTLFDSMQHFIRIKCSSK